MKFHIVVGMCSCFLFVYVTNATAEIRYKITDLGAFLGTTSSYGGALNSQGQVIVSAENGPFLYDGKLHDLSDIGSVSDLNDKGQLMGDFSLGTIIHAFFYDGTKYDLGTLGGNFTYAYGMNASGQITGYSQTSNFDDDIFLYDGTMHDLGVGKGQGINDKGWITGEKVFTPDLAFHAFLYDGTMHDLGTVGGYSSTGLAVNARGQVTGTSGAADGFSHAFFYDGAIHDLGTLGGLVSNGLAINASGQVVGVSETSQRVNHAFVYDNISGMVDLNSLIDPQLGWELYNAVGINDAGQISGSGTLNGSSHAFLLTPVPEPTSLTLVAAGFLILAGKQRMRRQPAAMFMLRP